MRKLAYLIGGAALLGSFGYLITYVARWQWNRALFSGMAFIAVLTLMGFANVLERLSQLRASLDDAAGGTRPGASPRQDVLDALASTRPRRDHFEWLRESLQRPNVFITLLLGGGVIVSGIAWVVGRVAEGTTSGAAEEVLADRLEPIAYPARGIAPPDQPGATPSESLLRGRSDRAPVPS